MAAHGAVNAAIEGLARGIAITVFRLAIAALNLRGVVQGAALGNVLVVLKLTPLFLLAPLGLYIGGWPQAAAEPALQADALGAAFLLAFFACMGFEQATIVAGELRSPKRDLPSRSSAQPAPRWSRSRRCSPARGISAPPSS